MKKVDGQFNHDQISELEVNKYNQRLKDNYDLFDSLHQRYCFLRPVNHDEEKEIKEQETDFEYFEDTENKYDALANLYV